jgi:hypothetical protein
MSVMQHSALFSLDGFLEARNTQNIGCVCLVIMLIVTLLEESQWHLSLFLLNFVFQRLWMKVNVDEATERRLQHADHQLLSPADGTPFRNAEVR